MKYSNPPHIHHKKKTPRKIGNFPNMGVELKLTSAKGTTIFMLCREIVMLRSDLDRI
jgi:hypothetical protein